jgi:alkylation response protein AidB-like acyl-CoA dehydrogenase
MTTVLVKESSDFLKEAKLLALEFAKDASERDKAGGTAKRQRDLLRESGLLHILTPTKYGGAGQSWSLALQIVRELAKVDAAVAHLYGYHLFHLVFPELAGTEEQSEYYYTETVSNNWFWANSSNPTQHTLIGKESGDHFILNGFKAFSTGSMDSDRLVISWVENAGDEEAFIAVIPTKQIGLTVNGDWDGFGQRQTDSGSVQFENVVVKKDEILTNTKTPFATLGAALSQIILANVFVGSAKGALDEAKEYTSNKSSAWYLTDYEKATDDHFIQRRYGAFWIDLQAGIQLVEKAGEKLDWAWSKGANLTEEERGETILYTGAANVFGTNIALDITSNIFEVMGARSATRKNNFDRYWRNVRTHSLHNPNEYKRKNIGKWLLTGEYPTPSDYS